MRRSANCATGSGRRPACRTPARGADTVRRTGCAGRERSRERWKPRRAGRILPLWGIAAAVVIGLFVCADLLRKPYCYIDGVAVYDKEVALQTTVYLESFSAFEESGRMVDELIRNN